MIKRFSMIFVLAVAALSFTGLAVAADSANNSANNGSQQKTQKLIKSYRQDAQQLKQIHDKTLKNNPQLAKEQNQFEKQVRSAVKKQGYNVKAGQKHMQAMVKKLQSGKLSDKQRKQVMQQFQNDRQKMVKARNAALSQPDIRKSGQKLQNDTINAMQKQNPNTKHLIAEMKSVRSQLQKQQQQSAKANGSGHSKN